MITRKLSKPQGYIVQGIVTNLGQLQEQTNEAQAALAAQANLLRGHFDLPEGESQFSRGPDGWSIVVTPAPPEPEPGVRGEGEDADQEEDREVP